MIKLPSIKLLNEVLYKDMQNHNFGYLKITDCAYDKINKSIHINYVEVSGIIRGYSINIHELEHKCKEWAAKHDHSIMSTKTTKGLEHTKKL